MQYICTYIIKCKNKEIMFESHQGHGSFPSTNEFSQSSQLSLVQITLPPIPAWLPEARCHVSLLIDDSLSPPQVLQMISNSSDSGWNVSRPLLHSFQMQLPPLFSPKLFRRRESLKRMQARLGATSGPLCQEGRTVAK